MLSSTRLYRVRRNILRAQGRRTAALLTAGLALAIATPGAAAAAAEAVPCPTVQAPHGLVAGPGGIVDPAVWQRWPGRPPGLTGNPLFATAEAAGVVPAAADRLPRQPLVVMPDQACGPYGGRLRGLSAGPTTGTSEIVSWRQSQLVRLAADGVTVVPDVVRAWSWDADGRAVTLHLRDGHRWSDGAPFTARDVAFWANRIIGDRALHPIVPAPWDVGMRAETLGDATVRIAFDRPFPAFLFVLASVEVLRPAFAPAHVLGPLHPAVTPSAEHSARAAGYADWVERFQDVWDAWPDRRADPDRATRLPTLASHRLVGGLQDGPGRRFEANPYFHAIDTAGRQLPYIDVHEERFLAPDQWYAAIVAGTVHQKSQNLPLVTIPYLAGHQEIGGYHLLQPIGPDGPTLVVNRTPVEPARARLFADRRFRLALSLAIDRDRLNRDVFLGLGQPRQALPQRAPFVTAADAAWATDHNPLMAARLLDAVGLPAGEDGSRRHADGSPFELTIGFDPAVHGPAAAYETVAEDWRRLGLDVRLEVTALAVLDRRLARGTQDVVPGRPPPFLPSLMADIGSLVVPFARPAPPAGAPWRRALDDGGETGRTPPDWAVQLDLLARQWRLSWPMSPSQRAAGRAMVAIHREELATIGTVGNLPRPLVLSRALGNVPDWPVSHLSYGFAAPYRPSQWFLRPEGG